MPDSTEAEAREAARREYLAREGRTPPPGFDAGWDARGRFDEEHIAALVARVDDCLAHPDHLKDVAGTICVKCLAALRAIAGQPEEAL